MECSLENGGKDGPHAAVFGRWIKERGRELCANRAIGTGEVLFEARPFAAALCYENLVSHCRQVPLFCIVAKIFKHAGDREARGHGHSHRYGHRCEYLSSYPNFR